MINRLKSFVSNKKGQIGGLGEGPIGILLTGGIGIVVLGLILTYSAKIAQDVQDDLTVPVGNVSTNAHTIAGNSTAALGTIGENLSTVALVLVGVAIITLLIGGFGFVLRR